MDQEHDWREMKVTPMMLDHLGELVPRGEPTQRNVGCWTCNMGWDEGKDVACPGQDLFEEETHARPSHRPHGRRYSVGD